MSIRFYKFWKIAPPCTKWSFKKVKLLDPWILGTQIKAWFHVRKNTERTILWDLQNIFVRYSRDKHEEIFWKRSISSHHKNLYLNTVRARQDRSPFFIFLCLWSIREGGLFKKAVNLQVIQPEIWLVWIRQ